jgi:hypothetical protein
MDPSKPADFSSLTHKFRANPDSQQGVNGKVNKRNRQPLSCAPCRIRKLKCDRGHPCEACIKRSEESNCSYGKSALVKPEAASGPQASSNRSRAQERLRHLEQLVMQMVETLPSQANDNKSPGVEISGDENATFSLAKEGHLQYGSTESRYVGSTHWSALLENLQELKSALNSSGEGLDQPSTAEMDESEDVDPPDLDNLFASPTNTLSLAQILAQSLPPRLQVDRRLSTYFRSPFLVSPFLHTRQFQRQYEQFWRTPLDTSPLWVSILFSICSLSAGWSERTGSEPSTPQDQNTPRVSFLQAACQCLRLGGFTRPKRFVCEALGLYSQCKYLGTLDPSKDVSLIFCLTVRLAYRSGYHRDPSQFPHLSVFEGEMRRRSWALLRQFDLMLSFQLGLPNEIPPNSWDTKDPRNLLDTDFDEDMKVLPPPRPEVEPTQILYFTVKSRLMTTFGKVCAHALSFRTESCNQCAQEVMELDREVRSTYATVPEVLHVKSMSQSYADPGYLTMVRTNCEFLYQKSLLVLHRKYMTTSTHPESAKICTDAAIAITKHMLDLQNELKPGGQLAQERWMFNSFTLNDFYLAGMVLCLSVSIWKRSHPGQDIEKDEKMREQYTMLRDSIAVCEEMSATSNEARRVARVFRVVLGGSAKDNSLTPASGAPASATLDTNAFMQSVPFMTSASSNGTQYDFNLTPLSLQDTNRLRDNMSSESGTSQQHRSPTDRGGMPNMNRAHANGFPLVGGINNPAPLGSNAWLGIMPFSRSQSQAPNNTSSNMTPAQTSRSENSSKSNSMALQDAQDTDMFDLPMDVDWPLFDQWMACANTAEMMPVSAGLSDPSTTAAMSFPVTGQISGVPGPIFSDGGGIQSSYPPLSEATMTSQMGRPGGAETGTGMSDKSAEWTSMPYPFLGGGSAM